MPCAKPAVSEGFADFISYYYTSKKEFQETYPSACVHFINGSQAVLHVPLALVTPLSLSRYTYSAVPKLYSLLDASSMESAGISEALRLPAFSQGGRGVLIGFVDTGIDFTNPLFLGPDQTTRILGIWDQTADGAPDSGDLSISDEAPDPDGASGYGNAPDSGEAFPPYGTAYSKEEIDQALSTEDPFLAVPSRDENGHGTFLASLAAGSPREEQSFTGAAPNAYIAMVKLKPAKQYLRDFYLIPKSAAAYQENDIMMGVSYLYALARRYSLPIVCCVCLGTSQGGHEGTSPLCQYLNALSSYSGSAVIAAAGNETGLGHHYRGAMAPASLSHTVELAVAENEKGFTMEFWAQEIELYTIGFISPTGEAVSPLPASTTDENAVTFLLEETKIRVYYQLADFSTGSQLILIRMEDPAPGIWRITVSASLRLRGGFHIWLPVREFISEGTYFLRPDPDTVITDPGNARGPVTVSAYDHQTGGIYLHASRGYTRLGQIKPDLAAPGVNVLGASPSGSGFIRMTGTSAAAAHTAGAAADLLSWGITEGNYPYMNTQVLKSLLIRGANRNPELPYPNREFGYGTLDLLQSFLNLRNQ